MPAHTGSAPHMYRRQGTHMHVHQTTALYLPATHMCTYPYVCRCMHASHTYVYTHTDTRMHTAPHRHTLCYVTHVCFARGHERRVCDNSTHDIHAYTREASRQNTCVAIHTHTSTPTAHVYVWQHQQHTYIRAMYSDAFLSPP